MHQIAAMSGKHPPVKKNPQDEFEKMMASAITAKNVADAEKFAKDHGIELGQSHTDAVHRLWVNQQLSQPEFEKELKAARNAVGL